MNNIFLIDKNIITYNDLIGYVNYKSVLTNYSDVEFFILKFVRSLVDSNVTDIDDLLKKIKLNNGKIFLKTSGTTGKPKDITHTFQSISKNIIVDSKYNQISWGLTYAQGKMAFYQVLLQSLLNKSKLINLYGNTFDEITKKIIKYNVSHISATPTFYRMLISSKVIFDKVNQITLGGEGSSGFFINELKKYFPNSKIKNIYASTETASIFASNSDIFKVPAKYNNKIKFINKTLFIHQDLLGEVGDKQIIDGWYNTQDMVEFVSDSEFKFVGREGFNINVSGFKVNPIKVESIINSLPYVINSIVYPKKNSVVGAVLCCDIVLSEPIEKSQLKSDLRGYVDKYEIPSIINFVDVIHINENMKISRV
jgi:acyl-coenzyme A synthetase/AMP-(fatty) acid ligase